MGRRLRAEATEDFLCVGGMLGSGDQEQETQDRGYSQTISPPGSGSHGLSHPGAEAGVPGAA